MDNMPDGYSGVTGRFGKPDRQENEPRAIVSLTSCPERMYDIHFCTFSLLNQITKPDAVILWLAEEQFP
jgi:hypothetical protein